MQLVSAHPPGLERFPFFVHEGNDVHISEKIRTRGVWEQFETQLLLALLGEQDQIIDIGANIGWYTVAGARRVGPAGRVFAFEPDPRNFAILTANLQQSGLSCVLAERLALGRESGTASIQSSLDNQGDLRVRDFRKPTDAQPSEADVRVVALDDYLARSPQFDLARLRILKLDVQGFEHEVLSGAKDLLGDLPRRAVCFVEFDPQLLADNAASACEGFIDAVASLGRRMFVIRRPIWRLQAVSVDDLRAAADPRTSNCYDLVIAHDEALGDLQRALPLIPRLLSAVSANRS
ncbi:MAG TPA: FkbM family methyltransferase [Steroidobacteraceae bacterium]|jgi:FkbM family methyltransferase